MREFARRLKEGRESLGLSQGQAAKAMRVSRVTVNRWERNKTDPTVFNVRRVQELLKVSEKIKETKSERQKD